MVIPGISWVKAVLGHSCGHRARGYQPKVSANDVCAGPLTFDIIMIVIT